MAEQVPPVSEMETVATRRSARPGALRATWSLLSPLPPFDNSAVDGYAVRHADIAASGETRLERVGPRASGCASSARARSRARRSAFSPARRCRKAQTRFICRRTSVRRRCGGRARRASSSAPTAGSSARICGRARWRCRRAGGSRPRMSRLPPRSGSLDSRCAAGRASRFSPPATRSSSRAASSGPAALFDANRYLLIGVACARSAPRPPISAFSPTTPGARRAAIGRRRQSHDLVLTSGGVSTGEADHVKTRGGAARQAGVLAARDQAGPAGGHGRGRSGAAFAGLPGNPVAVFVTFVHVVRPLLLRLDGRDGRAARRAAGARGVRIQEEEGPARICARRAAPAADGGSRRSSTRRKGRACSPRSPRPTGSRSCRGRDRGRARLDRRFSALRGAGRLAAAQRRTPEVGVGDRSRLLARVERRRPTPTATAMATARQQEKLFI